MSTPPSVLAMTIGREAARSSKTAQYNSFWIAGAAATRTLLTSRPSGPVCLVTSTLPSIALAQLKNLARRLAKLHAALKAALEGPLAASARVNLGFDDQIGCMPCRPGVVAAACWAASAESQTSPAGTDHAVPGQQLFGLEFVNIHLRIFNFS